MTSQDIMKFWPVIALSASMVVGGAVANEQIGKLQEDVKKLNDTRDQQIRMEERQKVIKADVSKLDNKLDNIEHLIRQIAR